MLPAISELYELYETLNIKYFDGKLPGAGRVTIEYSKRLTSSAGICYPKRKIIRLSTHYHTKFPEEAASTLLHEMVHLLVPGHGAQFKEWIGLINGRGGSVGLRARERATPAKNRWMYSCKQCGREYIRKIRLKNRGSAYRCRLCGGTLAERPLASPV